MFEEQITLSMDERISISLALEVAILAEIKKMETPLVTILRNDPDNQGAKDYLKVLNARIEEMQAINIKLGFERV